MMDLVDSSRISAQVRSSESEKKCWIVEVTLETAASVARVALRLWMNSHQVFQERKLYREGRLGEREFAVATLLPVAWLRQRVKP